MDFVEGQLAREEFLAVVGIGVAMTATEVAAIGQFELRLDYGLVGSGLLVDSLAKGSILDGWDGSLVKHGASWVG
jgi:hypothetical protein